ncbi:MAG: cytochrome b/b6 domain-containing protein [Firmicutes bacterium]|nr:cytochrome b/b6 domain-containing protein [Bacillota bacterium]
MSEIYRHPRWARILHWLHTVSMLVLIFSGFYITYACRAFLFPNMRSARLWHFIAAYIITAVFIARLYYNIAEKTYKNYLFTKADLREMPRLLKYYLFLTDEEPTYAVFNPGQKLMYLAWQPLLLVQAISGWLLYDVTRFQPIWLSDWLLSLNTLRTFHYLVAILFTITTAAHLYLVLSEDLEKLKYMIWDRDWSKPKRGK